MRLKLIGATIGTVAFAAAMTLAAGHLLAQSAQDNSEKEIER
jgi:hypothetical protein